MSIPARGLVVLLAGTLLAGCGFQMRGATKLPEDVRNVHVAGPLVFVDEIEVFLESGGASVTEDEEAADAIVNVGQETYQRRVLSVDPNTGKDREFQLVYTVRFSISRPDGTIAVDPEGIRIVRDYVFDQDQVLGKSREDTVLREEMRRDAAQELVRRMEVRLQ